MKKLVTLALTAMLMLCCVTAFAASSPSTDNVVMVYGNGVTNSATNDETNALIAEIQEYLAKGTTENPVTILDFIAEKYGMDIVNEIAADFDMSFEDARQTLRLYEVVTVARVPHTKHVDSVYLVTTTALKPGDKVSGLVVRDENFEYVEMNVPQENLITYPLSEVMKELVLKDTSLTTIVVGL